MWIGIGNSFFRRGGGVSAPDGNPSDLVLTVVSDTEIDGTFTEGSTNQDGFRVYISTDNVTFTKKTTVSSGSFQATGLTAGTLYYFYVVAYKGSNESEPTDTENAKIETELTAYLSGLVTPISGAEVDNINTFINELKVGLSITNLSDAFDYLKLRGGETSEISLRNIVKNAHHGVLQGATNPTFEQYVGFIGDGASGYIDENFNPNTEGSAYQQNSASLILYVRTNATSAGVDLGSQNTAATARSLVLARTTTNYVRGRLNLNGETSDTNYIATGIYIISRVASNDLITYVDKIAGAKVTTASSTPPAYNHYSHARNNNGSVDAYCARQLALVGAGKGFNQAEVNVITDAIEHYYDRHKNGLISLDGIAQNVAYCWFSRPKAVYSATADKTWIGVVKTSTPRQNLYTQTIITLDNATGIATSTVVGTVTLKDDHDEPSILVRSSDNKLVIAYCEHEKNKNVRVRISTNALDASAWGDEILFEGTTNVTYTQIYEAANGDIFIFYREDTAEWCYIKSTDGGATWGGRVNFFAYSTKSYLVSDQSPLDKDVIYFLGSGHPYTTDNNSVFAFYMDLGDAKFYKLDGTEITGDIPFDAAGDMTIVYGGSNPDDAWIEDVIVDATGKPRFLFTIYPNGDNTVDKQKDLYYSEWNGSALTTPYKIHTAMDKFINSTGADGVSEAAYPPLANFNVNDPDEIVAAKDTDGITEIYKLTRIASNNFSSEQLTFNSNYDQWRPFTAGNNQVFWLNKKVYDSYKVFTQSLLTDSL